MKLNLLIIFFLSSSFSFCQGKIGFQALVTIDNDFLAINNKDENYTGGVKLELLTPALKCKWLPYYKFKGENVTNVQRFGFGGTGYTPLDIASTNVVIGDRPFASIIYISVGSTSFHTLKKLILQSDLILGSIGGKGPGSVQAYIHEHHWFGSTRPVPNGWKNQIGNNGSFIFNYNTRLQGILFESKDEHKNFKLLQANWVSKADIGNYMINLQGGVKLNLLNVNMGILQDYNPDMPVTITSVIPTTGSLKKKVRFNLFAEPHVRLALYNATLEGLMFNDHSIYTIDHSKVKRVLLEINAGFNLLLGDVVYLRYSFYGRSKEFTGGKPFHSWGGVTIGFSPGKWNHN